MAVFKLNNSPFYHYEFRFQGQRFRGTTKETDQVAAERVEARRRALAQEEAVSIPDTVDRDWAAYQMVRLLDEVRNLRVAIVRIEESLERLITGKGAPRPRDPPPPLNLDGQEGHGPN